VLAALHEAPALSVWAWQRKENEREREREGEMGGARAERLPPHTTLLFFTPSFFLLLWMQVTLMTKQPAPKDMENRVILRLVMRARYFLFHAKNR